MRGSSDNHQWFKNNIFELSINLGFSKFTAHDILRWRPLLHVCELHTLKAASFFSGKTSPLVCRGAIYNIFTHLQLFTNTCSVYFPDKCVCRTKQLKAATRCAACSWLHSWFLLTKKNLSHSLEAETQEGTGSFYVCSLSGQSDTQMLSRASSATFVCFTV